jgi:NifB/MoaA-like Fe-S oxidoreductase
MGDSAAEAERAIAGVQLVGAAGLRFDGSMVAMPNVTGWEDLRATVHLLAAAGARSVRVIVPAYSSSADARMFPDADTARRELRRFVDLLPVDLPCPVLIEPSCVSDLASVVSGVFRGSPAAEAGVRRGDVVLSVNGKQPRCRVEAWRLLSVEGELVVDLMQPGGETRVRWVNRSGSDPGLAMEYDFDPERMDKVAAAVQSCEGRVLLLTSRLGHAVIVRVLELLGLGGERAVPVPVENRTFGGTIGAAGLLTLDDYSSAFRAWSRLGHGASLIIVPLESFDFEGIDLKGRHYSDLSRSAGVPVMLL